MSFQLLEIVYLLFQSDKKPQLKKLLKKQKERLSIKLLLLSLAKYIMNKKTTSDYKKTQDEILNLKKTILNLNFQKLSGQLEKTSQLKNAKKQIARLKTKLQIQNGDKNA